MNDKMLQLEAIQDLVEQLTAAAELAGVAKALHSHNANRYATEEVKSARTELLDRITQYGL